MFSGEYIDSLFKEEEKVKEGGILEAVGLSETRLHDITSQAL
jgi:hypothetical protein